MASVVAGQEGCEEGSSSSSSASASTSLASKGSKAGPSGGRMGDPLLASPAITTSSQQAPQPFEMESSASKTYREFGSEKFTRRRNCFGLWLDTSGEDEANKVSAVFALFSVGIIISVGMLTVKYFDGKLPTALQVKDLERHPSSFIEERARNDLHRLTSVGVRVSGSHQTDVETVEGILGILKDIESHGLSNHVSLEYEVHHPTGAVEANWNLGSRHTSCYSKIANVVAKLEPRDANLKTNHSILVNCHFDTKPGSPGATDNMISCSTMLEVIRVLASESQTSLKNTLIFLFNGAEELGLQGAHGYDAPLGNPHNKEKGHRWAKNLRTFINLEGAGGGGREILFQTGPGNSWTLKAYAKAVPYPYGFAIAEEAFQIGLIPSDTDFRIFRDYGGLAGLDMAFIKNGWVYHTKWDRLSEIDPGSLQHMGANALAIVREMSGNLDFDEIEDSGGKMVFFDVLGLFMIYYPRWAGIVIDCVVGLGSIVAILFSLRTKAENTRNLIMSVIWLPLSAILSWGVGVGTSVIVGLLLNACGYYKPFYSYPILATVLFSLPATIAQICFHSYANNRSPVQSWAAEKLALAFILVIMTFVTRAVFIISINLIFSVISWYLTRYCCRGWPRAITLSYLIGGEFIPFLMSFYLQLTLADVFVPILGRSGSETNANLFYGVITAAVAVVLVSNGFVFLFTQFRRRVLWLSLFASVVVLNSLLVFGFIGKVPYQEKTPLRLNIVDVHKTLGGGVNETGYWIWPYDSNTEEFFPILEKSVPELASIEKTRLDYENCDDLYCAQPFLWPADSIKTTYWLPHKDTIPKQVKEAVSLTSTVLRSSLDERTINFALESPAQFTIVLSPGPSYKLVNWTLTEDKPDKSLEWKGREAYYIFHSRGFTNQTISFSLNLARTSGSAAADNKTLLNIQYTGFYLFGDNLMTNEFRDLIDRMPGWTYSMVWTAIMKMYEIQDVEE